MPRIVVTLFRALLAGLAVLVPMHAKSQDIALAAPVGSILSPVSGVGLSANESVTVALFNFGPTLPAGTAFNVSYNVNAGLPVTEMIVLGTTLLANTAFNYTFTTQADLSVPGSYTFMANVSLPGDVNPSNDSYVNYVVTNTAPSVGGTVSRISNGFLLSGHTGRIVQWERSSDGGLTWQVLDNTTTVLSSEGADHRELYRAIVANATASPVPSSVFDTANP